ncbi:MAG: signal peptidase I [Rhabdochlamydiaceae bacterium]|jgi:signal peptidase I
MKKNKHKIIVLTIAALIIVVQAFAKPYHVSGDCMEPTITDGQLCLVNQISPYLRQYQIDDIISFKHEGKVWISRVVALETNTIQITEGSVVVNDVPCQDTGIHRSWSDWKHGVFAIDKPLKIPPAHVFVLSDNLAAQHDDSRSFGPVSTESITGLIWYQ